ncbi:MAG TPA: amidohydrolase [Thermoanaerobaculia bacterium]|nr:amidohydrolase [Thermoanaerobaculia bacterium]
MRKLRRVGAGLLGAAIGGSLAVGAAAERPAADLIVENARVHTVDRARPEAQAVAVVGERIVAVGSSADVGAWRGPRTRVVDAKGKLVLPGFDDAHVHFSAGGLQLDQVQLRDARSQEELKRRIAERARTHPKEWMLGGRWDHENWTPADLPARALIDDVTPDTPVLVERLDGHMALANSAALRLAKIGRDTADPPGGLIVRDAKGEPTGIVKDAAVDIVAAVIPLPTRDVRARAIRAALAHAARLGVTSVQEMNPDAEDVSVYAELLERGELTARLYEAPPIATVADWTKVGVRHAFGSPWLRVGALKQYADGSLGSTTAYFFEPYLDSPKTSGLVAEDLQPIGKSRERMLRADAAGLQICTHAIGDRAISTMLDLYAELEKAHGARDRRLRIEHAQHIAPKDFDRFKALDVVASMQPYHCIDDGRWAEKRIGPERAKTTYAFRTLLDKGVRLAFGTDWAVADLNPLMGLYAAVTRATLDGKRPGGWVPEQKISLAEAIECYTLGSAYAEFQEKEKGTIAVGKLADMVLVSDDLFHIPPEKIKDAKIVMTIVGGRVVYEAK